MFQSASLDTAKFRDPDLTAKGEPRARVDLKALDVLWFNTGTLCNIACRNCYIESTPLNDALVYLTVPEVETYLDEIEALALGTRTIGLTGGEPFMNPAILDILDACLTRGFHVLVLTNAMRPMMRWGTRFLDLARAHRDRLTVRVSLDHYRQALHEGERGAGTWAPAIEGLGWLVENGITVHVAARMFSGESDAALRAGFARLFAREGFPIDAADPAALTIFPEMDACVDVPEITASCWGTLNKSPDSVMCATSRMVVKRKGAERPCVFSCTLLPYSAEFELGPRLADALGSVALNHPHCAKFCVLGGASCGG